MYVNMFRNPLECAAANSSKFNIQSAHRIGGSLDISLIVPLRYIKLIYTSKSIKFGKV